MAEVRQLTDDGHTPLVKQVPAPSAQPALRAPRKRPWLLFGIPALVVAAASYAYLQGGRYVETNNAYVKADKAIVAAQVSGRIVSVAVTENERVEPDQVLFTLDPAPFQVALDRADAALAQTRSDVAALQVAYGTALAEIELAQTNVDYAQIAYKRQTDLVTRRLAAVSDLDDAHHLLESAAQQVVVARRRAEQILADLNGDSNSSVEAHPRYLHAAADRAQAVLELEHSVVRAPFAGITNKKPEIGNFAERGMPIMSVVSERNLWVEANFKETDLTHLRDAQPTEVTVDTYPGKHWYGTVQSISEATGAEFAILPAQNATGNWVKVVQRIAVRVAIDVQPGDPPLRAGMSAEVVVDTGHTRTVKDLLPHWR